MSEFVSWFMSVKRSSWGELDTLREAQEVRPTLAGELLGALAAGSLELPSPPASPASTDSVLEWIGTDGVAVDADLLLPYLQDAVAPSGHRAAGALGQQWGPVARDAAVALLEEGRPERRALGFQVIAVALQAERVQPSEARRLLPLATAGKKRITKKLGCPTAAVLDLLEGLARHRPEPPGVRDLTALAAGAPQDPGLRVRAMALAHGRLVTFQELADRLGLALDEARALAAAVALESETTHWSEQGLAGLWVYAEAHASMWPIPVNGLEQLVAEGNTADLDALLQPTPRLTGGLQKRKAPRPPLRWRGGAAVSGPATDLLLACLDKHDPVSRGLLDRVEPEAWLELGRWLLSDPAKHKRDRHVLPPSEAVAAEVWQAWSEGSSTLRPWLTLGLEGTRTHRRNLIRTWVGSRPADRDALRLEGGQGIALPLVLDVLPDVAPEDGDFEGWLALGRAALRDVLADQTVVWASRVRALGGTELGAAILQDVVFVAEDGSLVRLGGLERARTLRVASARVDDVSWPTGPDPLGQRAARVALPDVEGRDPLPAKVWTQRLQALGYTAVPESSGGSLRARWVIGDDALVLHHSGTGKGYGRSPVRLRSARTERGEGSPPTALDALARDVRMLLGEHDGPCLPDLDGAS